MEHIRDIKKHFKCNNCKRVYKIQQKNGYMCSGLVRCVYKNDYYRLCMVRTLGDKNEVRLDLKYEEVRDIGFMMSNLMIKRPFRKKGEGYVENRVGW